MTSRRTFLRAGGVLAAAAATQGCADVFAWQRGTSHDSATPFGSPVGREIDRISHSISRLSYGARPGDWDRVRALGATEDQAIARYIDEQLQFDKRDESANRAVRRLEAIAEPLGELYEYSPAVLHEQLCVSSLLRAVHGERQLHEIMVAFWADHFNIDSSKGDCRWLTPAFNRAVLHPHALGRFPELLRAVVLSPGMLWYLDGRVNRRGSASERPNENYARELLELHTLGVRGGYTQYDVMETARALTGWTVRSKHASFMGIGRVAFDAALHDDGAKRVLGRDIPPGGGASDVDALLRIVTGRWRCATFIATKLCRRFIDESPSPQSIDAVSRTFAATGGDINASLRTLFDTAEFRTVRASRLKRPFHFIVSALRAVDAQTDDAQPITRWLERMGHVPFQFPTPDGYPDNAASWTGTLQWRWQFATALAENGVQGTRVARDDLRRRAGGDDGLLAHLFGRTATMHERAAADASGDMLALALASPAFQRY